MCTQMDHTLESDRDPDVLRPIYQALAVTWHSRRIQLSSPKKPVQPISCIHILVRLTNLLYTLLSVHFLITLTRFCNFSEATYNRKGAVKYAYIHGKMEFFHLCLAQ
jgi:hypothetical protein